jgi:FtsP/CotA-like multicopper oxidase with cupredoxin domain
MAAGKGGQTDTNSSSLADQQSFETEHAQKERREFSRRRLLIGATVLGGSFVAVSGIALATQNSISHAAEANSQVQTTESGKLREYWIQADSFHHNLIPTGYDGLMGMHFTPDQTSFWALGYRAYTSGWGQPLAGNDDIGPNTGIPGPILRGSVGDTIRVHFRNNDTHRRFPHSMHPHGVSYTPENDGGWFAADPRPGTVIEVGESYTYNWQVRPNSVGTWVYHDHSAPQGKGMLMEFGAELGLVGMLILTDTSTHPVDRECCVFFHDLYQADIPVLSQDFDAFNGHSYVGNTPTFTARVGERVRWHIGALGKEFHVFHLHGHRWLSNGQYVDTVLLGPSMATSFEYVEDNPGKWLYHCHVSDHMMGGMSGLYVVKQ